MKLQQIAKLISKNVTILSIASAFALGLVGMTDIKTSLFDTSTWFMQTEQSGETEFENVAADPDMPDFDFGKNTEITEPEITEEPSESSTKETTIEQTTTEMTTSESETSSEPSEVPSDSTSSSSEAVVTEGSSAETTESTKATETTTAQTTKAVSETTEAPAETTTKAPAETSSEDTTAPEETTATPTTTKKKETSQGDTSGSYNDGMAKEVLDLVNEQRAANGLAPLSWSGSLAKGAKSRATEIVVKWDHSRPDGSEWYTAPGCEDAYGENLAKGYGSASSAMDGWMNSSGHRANILKAEYKTLGVACYVCNGQYYWVQEFGY